MCCSVLQWGGVYAYLVLKGGRTEQQLCDAVRRNVLQFVEVCAYLWGGFG